jgi:WD40 repeat protein
MSNPQSAIRNPQPKIVPRRVIAVGPARVRLDPAIWLPWLVGGVLMVGLLGAVLVLGGGGRESTLTHPDSVSSVAFSPDGALLASGAADSVVRLWNPARGLPMREPVAVVRSATRA